MDDSNRAPCLCKRAANVLESLYSYIAKGRILCCEV